MSFEVQQQVEEVAVGSEVPPNRGQGVVEDELVDVVFPNAPPLHRVRSKEHVFKRPVVNVTHLAPVVIVHIAILPTEAGRLAQVWWVPQILLGHEEGVVQHLMGRVDRAMPRSKETQKKTRRKILDMIAINGLPSMFSTLAPFEPNNKLSMWLASGGGGNSRDFKMPEGRDDKADLALRDPAASVLGFD
jgi:hypothetical protein